MLNSILICCRQRNTANWIGYGKRSHVNKQTHVLSATYSWKWKPTENCYHLWYSEGKTSHMWMEQVASVTWPTRYWIQVTFSHTSVHVLESQLWYVIVSNRFCLSKMQHNRVYNSVFFEIAITCCLYHIKVHIMSGSRILSWGGVECKMEKQYPKFWDVHL